MSDNKTDEQAVPVADQHPLNFDHDDILQVAGEATNKEEHKVENKTDTKEIETTETVAETHHNNDFEEKGPTAEEDSDSHPLQERKDEEEEEEQPVASYAYNAPDPWAQQESSLLDDQGQPNASSLHSATPSPTPEQRQQREKPLDPDTSHIKGFFNANDANEILDLQVEGQLPNWLNGEHYTIGPGIYDIRYMRKIEIDGILQSATATFTFGHWFDSLPMANRFDFNGKRNAITYRNRLTSRRLIEKIRDHHGYAPCHPGGLFKTDSNQTPLVKFLKSAPKASKPDGEPCGARILPSIPGVDGRLFAQNLANHIQELDPFDLKPTRLLCWNEINPAFKGYTSCPNGQVDPRTGEYINFTMEVGYQSTRYNFFSISDRNPKGSIIASVNAPTGYVHSFSVTPRYVVLVVFPMLAHTAGVKFAWNESILDSFAFYPNEPTLFYVISREKGQHIATYRSSACFAFHHVNAFEEAPDNINVDIVCYKDDTIAHQLSTHSLRNPSEMKPSRLAPSEVRRYVLSNLDEESISFMASNSMIPSTASVTSRITSVWSYFRGTANTNADVESSMTSPASGWYANLPEASFTKIIQPSLELPQVNPLYSMHKYKYLYGLGFSAASSIADGTIWDSIVKADVDTRNIVATWHEDNCYPSEAVFIPRPAASAEDELKEDDGVLVSVVMDSARATSFLLVLDAATLQVLARANLETLIPLSFGRGSYRLRT